MGQCFGKGADGKGGRDANAVLSDNSKTDFRGNLVTHLKVENIYDIYDVEQSLGEVSPYVRVLYRCDV